MLEPEKTLPSEATPPAEKSFLLALRQGDYVEIRVEQLEGLGEVTFESSGEKPGVIRFRDTGKHGIIRSSLIAVTDATYVIRIRSYHKDAAVKRDHHRIRCQDGERTGSAARRSRGTSGRSGVVASQGRQAIPDPSAEKLRSGGCFSAIA